MTSSNYNPVQCLNEHLNYFTESIASDELFQTDFDLIFEPFSENDHQVNMLAFNEAQPVSNYHPVDVKPYGDVTSMGANTYSQPQPQAVQTKAFARNTVIEPAPVSPTCVADVFTPQPVAQKPKSSPRKRSYSVAIEEPVASSGSSVVSSSSSDNKNLSFEEQEDQRRERNRHHAKRSRQRKRSYMSSLEEAVNEMRKENERLCMILNMDVGEAKAKMAKDEEHKAAVATDKFIAGLKQPRNRVLDNTTLAFLRELWK